MLLLTFSHKQQDCSRRLWKHICKNTEKVFKYKYNYWKELKTLWKKKNLLVLNNFYFCHNVFKSRLLQRLQKASICGKALIYSCLHISCNIREQMHFTLLTVLPFRVYNNVQLTSLKTSQIGTISINKRIFIKYSWKYCDKKMNC